MHEKKAERGDLNNPHFATYLLCKMISEQPNSTVTVTEKEMLEFDLSDYRILASTHNGPEGEHKSFTAVKLK